MPKGAAFDCGQCRPCLDKPQFGGPGRLKQATSAPPPSPPCIPSAYPQRPLCPPNYPLSALCAPSAPLRAPSAPLCCPLPPSAALCCPLRPLCAPAAPWLAPCRPVTLPPSPPSTRNQGCMMRDPNAKISRASPGNPNPAALALHTPLGAMPVSGSPGAPPFAFPPCRSGAPTAAGTLTLNPVPVPVPVPSPT